MGASPGLWSELHLQGEATNNCCHPYHVALIVQFGAPHAPAHVRLLSGREVDDLKQISPMAHLDTR